VELLYLFLGICLSACAYFLHKLTTTKKTQKSLRLSKQRMLEREAIRVKENIFRQMAIEEIAKQKLVYDEKTGRYVRRRQVD
jgi:hypothetical protein